MIKPTGAGGWFRGLLAMAIVASGCAGELTDEEMARAIAIGGVAGRGAGGASGAAGAGGAAGAREAGGAMVDSCAVAVMNRSCAMAGCHGASSPAAGLSLIETVIMQPATLVDKRNGGDPNGCAVSMSPLVDSREPEKSLIYRKVVPPVPCGVTMPIGPALTSTDTACILRWIESIPGVGAQE